MSFCDGQCWIKGVARGTHFFPEQCDAPPPWEDLRFCFSMVKKCTPAGATGSPPEEMCLNSTLSKIEHDAHALEDKREFPLTIKNEK